MQLSISALDIEGVDEVVRRVDLPAIVDGPLYRLMFPPKVTEDQQAEIINWYVRGLADALHRPNDTIIRICDDEGNPLGFCGWTIEEKSATGWGTATTKQASIPDTLNIPAWSSISRRLKKERERALEGRERFCRLTFMSVHPRYQRQGLGSRLLQHACDRFDQLHCPAFAMASPSGVSLYRKFGFSIVGKVETSEGTFSSMLRICQADDNRPQRQQQVDVERRKTTTQRTSEIARGIFSNPAFQVAD